MDNSNYIVFWYAPNGSVDGSSFLTNFSAYKAKMDAIRFADSVNGLVIKTDFSYRGNTLKPYKPTKLQKCDRNLNPAAALGSITSEKKAAAARENGKKGGRPPKLS